MSELRILFVYENEVKELPQTIVTLYETVLQELRDGYGTFSPGLLLLTGLDHSYGCARFRELALV